MGLCRTIFSVKSLGQDEALHLLFNLCWCLALFKNKEWVKRVRKANIKIILIFCIDNINYNFNKKCDKYYKVERNIIGWEYEYSEI